MKTQETHILVCALNWGLGHSTRCIPLIEKHQKHGKVSLAGSGISGKLVHETFPHLPYYELPDYHIRYSGGNRQWPTLLAQGVKMLKTLWEEQQLIEKLQSQQHFTTIISDSRPGCYSTKTKNIYLCHHLNIQGFFFSKLLNHIHRWQRKPFHEIWIPDNSGPENLSGALSYPHEPKARFIGHLSQFKLPSSQHEEKGILAILSGPEPQRSILEAKLLEIQKEIAMTIVGGSLQKAASDNYIPMANRDELSILISKAKIVISRSGYTTLMDLIALNKKAILIPTPGQTEQEYLAKNNANKPLFTFISQKDLHIKTLEKEIRRLG